MNSKLKIVTCSKDGRTYPEEVFFSAPYKLTNCFPDTSGGIEYILMNSSPGIMANDKSHIDIYLEDNSRLILSSQSYEKILKMEGECASRRTLITVNHNAHLKFFPLPVIPFADSAFESHTTINLADQTAKLIYADFISSGRYHNQERFKYKTFISKLNVFLGDKLIYRDNSRFIPEIFSLSDMGMYENFNCLANLLIYGFNLSQRKLSLVNDLIGADTKIESALTELPYTGTLLRALAYESNDLHKFVNKAINIIESDLTD